MIDTWFKKDVEKIFGTHAIVVFIDQSGDAGFLLDELKGKYQLFRTNNEVEELKAKYERHYPVKCVS